MFDFGYGEESDAEIRRQALTQAKKNKIKRAVGNVCEIPRCKSQAYDVHHIVPLSKGGRNLGSNLIVLCANCHRDAHAGKFTQAELKKIVQKRNKKVKSTITAILRDRMRVETSERGGDPFKISIPEVEIPTIDLPDPFGTTPKKRKSTTKCKRGRKKTSSKRKSKK